MPNDDYTQGWVDANEAIEHKLPGHKDLSQGITEWDKGWNARIEQERIDETEGRAK